MVCHTFIVCARHVKRLSKIEGRIYGRGVGVNTYACSHSDCVSVHVSPGKEGIYFLYMLEGDCDIRMRQGAQLMVSQSFSELLSSLLEQT
jgi:nitrous oxidase accessory protein NosD